MGRPGSKTALRLERQSLLRVSVQDDRSTVLSFRAALVPPKTAGYSAAVSSTTTISTTGTRESAETFTMVEPPAGDRRQILLEAQGSSRTLRSRNAAILPPAGINPPLEKTTLHDAAQAPLAAASIPGVPPFSASRNQILVVDVDRADLTSLPTIIEAH